ncbi:lipid-A-disaccharide synthase [Aeoliella mucimassa]|uniref:Lipid-A-disaccharide synthase n=1 Tax=Aeoliella mucimassa TaxID=2527972 RepID=A0A518AIY0_9BACT|nr:lipid-A-disaccharide synthase [Aeoliella mucimassa]QDU54695.1 Glycosyl transferase [Aeoliella mucimassa]
MRIFFSVGEPSGDLHGANLIRALQARHGEVECVGFGGPRMAAAGCELHQDLTQLAIMWFGRALLHLPKFFGYLRQAEEYFAEQRPDAVVLIDYPGFNWHVARKAHEQGIPVFYYGTPQLWAWAGWRVKKMRATVDHALCKLPFEEDWLRERGVNATYVGHPYFDELRARELDQTFIASMQATDSPLVTILPGSRTQEVKGNLRDQLIAAAKIREQVPNVRFAIASFKESQAEFARQLVAESGLPVDVHVGRTPELIEAATCTMAVSGSVSLELLYHAKPTVITYRISRFAYALQRYFRKVRYITLVNLLTATDLFPDQPAVYDAASPEDAHVLMPEYLSCEDRTDDLARHVVEWLTNDAERESLVARMRELASHVAHGGASERAADYLIEHLGNSRNAEAA